MIFMSIYKPQVKSSLSREGVLTITAPRGNPVAAQSYTQTLENKMDKVGFYVTHMMEEEPMNGNVLVGFLKP